MTTTKGVKPVKYIPFRISEESNDIYEIVDKETRVLFAIYNYNTKTLVVRKKIIAGSFEVDKYENIQSMSNTEEFIYKYYE